MEGKLKYIGVDWGTASGSTTTYVKVGRARNESGEGEHWRIESVAPTLNLFDFCDSGGSRAVTLVVSRKSK